MNDPIAQKPAPGGLGWSVYLAAAGILALALAGLHRFKQARPEPQPVPFAAEPARTLSAPESPLLKAGEKDGGSLGFVKTGERLRGMDLETIPGEPQTAGAGVFFTGEGGPARFKGYAVRSRKGWAALWRSVGGHDMPELRTETEMAVAVFAGDQPAGSTVDILSASPEQDRLVVYYKVLPPANPRKGRCRPYKVTVMPITQLPVVFREAR